MPRLSSLAQKLLTLNYAGLITSSGTTTPAVVSPSEDPLTRLLMRFEEGREFSDDSVYSRWASISLTTNATSPSSETIYGKVYTGSRDSSDTQSRITIYNPRFPSINDTSADKTLECTYKIINYVAGDYGLLQYGDINTTGNITVGIASTTQLYVEYTALNQTPDRQLVSVSAPTTSTKHIAIVIKAAGVDVYYNGDRVHSTTTHSSIFNPTASKPTIVVNPTTPINGVVVYDELRFSSIARYTGSAYIIPTFAFDVMPDHFELEYTYAANTRASLNLYTTGTNIQIDWGDGAITSSTSHTYSTYGVYTVKVYGSITAMDINYNGGSGTLCGVTAIRSFGKNSFAPGSRVSSEYLVRMLSVPARLNPNITSTKNLFNRSGWFEWSRYYPPNNGQNIGPYFNDPNVALWDTSNVTSMEGMFINTHDFNQDLSDWDVSKVTTMRNMFNGAPSFNSNISSWDVSSVTTMQAMFGQCMSFNQPIGNWNVSNVTKFWDMFNMGWNFETPVPVFNQPIGNWNVSNGTSFNGMFLYNSAFNQPLDNWNMISAVEINGMFYDASSFNQPLNSWNTSNIIDMGHVFGGATAFNQPLNNWDVSKVWRFGSMFVQASSFNQPLNNWNTSSGTYFNGMFAGATIFNQDISMWNMSAATNTGFMFQYAPAFNQPIGSWNVSNVTNMSGMFAGARAFNQDLSTWDVSKVTDMSSMFQGTTFNHPSINSWNTISLTNMYNMFGTFYGPTVWNSSFNQPLNNWKTASVSNMDYVFYQTPFNQNISNWCVSLIPSRPTNFASNLSLGNEPVWGTCPP